MKNISDWLTDKLDAMADWLARTPPMPEPISVVPSTNTAAQNITSDEAAPMGAGPITRIPPGEQDISFSANIPSFEELYKQFSEFRKMNRLSQKFADKVKNDHRLPPLEAETLKELGVRRIMLESQPSGNYKITAINFDDHSVWANGKVQERELR